MAEPLHEAPPFSLPDEAGNTVTLKGYRGSWVLIFFYPREFSLVCTREVCSLRDSLSQFRQRRVHLLGVSLSPPERRRRFSQVHQLPFPLLWDKTRQVARQYGVLGFGGWYCRRSYFLVDPQGRIAWRHIERFQFRQRSTGELLEAIDLAQLDQPPLPPQPKRRPQT